MQEPNLVASATALQGATAVVTGASSGIGRAMALALAKAGADIVVHARSRRQQAEETAQTAHELGRQTLVLLGDISDPSTRERLAAEAFAWKPIDYWINNAGADVLTGEAAEWSFERKLERLWQVDVLGTVFLSRLVGERMQSDPRPGDRAILNIGWDQAQTGMGGDSGQFFACAKGAVIAFTRSLARTLAPRVRVNCLAPGWIQTAWGSQTSDYWRRRAEREALLSRWGTPEDVAAAAVFLCSPAASFITGHVMPVNGGYRGEMP